MSLRDIPRERPPLGGREGHDALREPGTRHYRSPYDAAPRTALPDLAELYDRRRPDHLLDTDDGSRGHTGLRFPARPLDDDLRVLGLHENREPLGEPTVFDRGHQAIRRRLAHPGHIAIVALLVASPFLLTALVASLLSVVGPLSGTDRIPLATVIVLLFVALCMVTCYALQLVTIARVCLVNLVTLGTLMPLLALQSTFSAVPYVSTTRSSAQPVVMTALALIVVLIAVALLSASLSWESPGDATVLFLPAGLIVPVVLGGPAADIPERGLATIVSVSIAAAIAAAGAQVLPEPIRPVIGPIAIMVELGALFAAHRGPGLPDSSGTIVRVLLWVILVLAVVLTVLVPLIAAWLRHLAGDLRVTRPSRPVSRTQAGGAWAR